MDAEAVATEKKARKEYKRKWIAKKRASVKKSKVVERSQSSSSDEDEGSCQSEHIVPDEDHSCGSIDEAVDAASSASIPPDHADLCMDQFLAREFKDNQGDWTWDMIDTHMIQSSTDESDQDDNVKNNFSADLAKLLLQHGVSQNFSDDLLKLLKECGHPYLPKTARSLLRTPRETKTQEKSGMDYKYLGLVPALTSALQGQIAEDAEITELKLSLNIDGLPIFKSTKESLWPILCAVMNIQPLVVFPIALAYGRSKPADLSFLDDTITDLHDVIQNGLSVDGKSFKVSLQCVICDAPAKAMVKNIKLYSGYYGCDKCSQKGVHLGKMTYQQVEYLELRNDATFRNQVNTEHHHGETPFCDLPIDMVNTFPIDYMHQVCLGVVKRCIFAWIRGKREVRISSQQISEISNKLLNLQRFIPKLFARKPRSLAEVDRWKATEYRQFLLYTGKIVLKKILPKALYDHFLVLSVALSILVSPRLTDEFSDYAHKLLVYFVSKSAELYGNDFLVYNVHSLLHLTQDAVTFGCLESCSAFPFENYMQQLKKMVRSTKNPIAQIARRLTERQQVSTARHVPSADRISFKKPNNAYVLNDTFCCEVTAPFNGESETGEVMYLCRVYEKAKPLFTEPCDSSLIDAYTVKHKNSHMKVLALSDLSTKAIKIESSHRKSIFLAILHEV